MRWQECAAGWKANESVFQLLPKRLSGNSASLESKLIAAQPSPNQNPKVKNEGPAADKILEPFGGLMQIAP